MQCRALNPDRSALRTHTLCYKCLFVMQLGFTCSAHNQVSFPSYQRACKPFLAYLYNIAVCVGNVNCYFYFNIVWQGQQDSNPRHSVLETDALPAELYPYNFIYGPD
jgi:hypothetical protein